MDITSLENEFHIRDYINVLRRRCGISALFFIAVVSTVTIASFIMTPIYRATATLLIDVESPDVLTTSGVVALEAQNYYSYKEYYQSQKEIITSRSIMRKVFEEFDLANTPEYAEKKQGEATNFLEKIGLKHSLAGKKDLIKKFSKTIEIEPVRDTRLLKLHVDNKDPKLAAEIANRIAETYVRRNLYYISRDELMNLLKNEYLKFETKRSEYNKVYKHKHPKMIQLKEEIDELIKRVEDVKKSAFEYKADTDDFVKNGKYTLEGLKANNVSVEDFADVPVMPIKPKKGVNIALAIIVGFFGGLGLAFFAEYLDDTVRTLEDTKKLAEWPFLGGVPIIKTGGMRMSEIDKDLLTHLKPKDPASESYRAIRTSIYFSSTEERPLRTMLMTSPGPQEGKTTTLCNLAIAIAQSQKSVLLVDADMRKPRLHEVFKKKNEIGLSDYLCGISKFESLIKETEIANISLVTGGTHPPNPSELLATHKMKSFIRTAKQRFDFILFDTPPIAVVTDAIVLSEMTDGLILVVESGKTSRRILPRILQILESAKTRVIGTILNKISTKDRNYHYYYYSHYYGKEKPPKEPSVKL